MKKQLNDTLDNVRPWFLIAGCIVVAVFACDVVLVQVPHFRADNTTAIVAALLIWAGR